MKKMTIHYSVLFIAIVLATAALPLASSFSLSASTALPVVTKNTAPGASSSSSSSSNDNNKNNNLNIFASARAQFQRNNLKRKLIAAANEKDEELIESLVEELSNFNPTDCPTLGLAGYGTASSSAAAPLDGSWRLLYTNAKDAEAPARTQKDQSNESSQFGDSVETGVEVTTGQTIDATKGECVNYIALNGENRPFDRLDITIQMTPLSDTRVRLDFLRGRALNEKAPLPFLKDFRFSFPPALVGDVFARIRGKDPRVEPPAYFDILYIDDKLRAHRTGEGKIFVQERA